MSKKSRDQRKRKRSKLQTEIKATPKESKIVLKEETGKKGRIEGLNYLVLWNNKDKKSDDIGSTWKFNKTRQVWLLKNMYMLERMPAKYFKLMLKYLPTIQGNSSQVSLNIQLYLIISYYSVFYPKPKRLLKLIQRALPCNLIQLS